MLGDQVFTLHATFATYRLRVHRFGAPPDAAQAELRRQARLDLRVGIEWREPEIIRVAVALDRALSGWAFHDFGDFRHVSSHFLSEQQLEGLAHRLAEAFDLGRISVERESLPSLTDRQEPFTGKLPPLPPPPKEKKTTFFDVRFVDEIGKAITGVQVEYKIDGGFRDVTTNAAGVALLEDVMNATAEVRIAEVGELEKALGPRWQTRRAGRPPKEANLTTQVYRGLPVGPVGVKSVVPNTVVIQPPRGRIALELLDKSGRVRHANREYTISGPEPLSGKTDESGFLVHEGVLPGDYTLKLTLEFFEGKDKQSDTYLSPLVVLPASQGTPERRLLGVVPFSVLARLRFFFNTNKTFLLPTALPRIGDLRRLYRANNPSKLLVVAHADTAGGTEYNDKLSLERAEATIAFLKDDVDAWLKFYEASVPAKNRWGRVEDHLMFISLPDFRDKPQGEDEVRWFQRTRKLEVDGKAGPKTRRQLVTEYMRLDGLSLKDLGVEVDAVAHGCGEHFPLDESGEKVDAAPEDEKRDPMDRRVELFFFDPEFGIVPPPPGKNSKAGSTEYPAWRKSVIQNVELEAGDPNGPKVTFIELVDALFRTNSAVVLPEGERPTEDTEKHESRTSIGAFAILLRHNEENPDQFRVFVAGHTDTTGEKDFNLKLSKERADCALAVLEGNRQKFIDLCSARHDEVDVTQIFDWAARALSFSCKPTKLDAPPSNATYQAFRASYNAFLDEGAAAGEKPPRGPQKLAATGRLDATIWGAIFDLYEFNLRDELGEDADGVKELRGKLKFVDEQRKALGFGELFPIEELGVDHYESQSNRRVELLLFKETLPDLEHAEKDPETSEVYLPGFFGRAPIDLESVDPRGFTLKLFLHDENQLLMRNTEYELEIGEDVRRDVTDDNGLLVQVGLRKTKTCLLRWKLNLPLHPPLPGKPWDDVLEESEEPAFICSREITLVPDSGSNEDVAKARLGNLGYLQADLDANWQKFQLDYGLEEKAFFDQGTFDRLAEVHGSGLEPDQDKATPAEGPEPEPEEFEDDGRFFDSVELELKDSEGRPVPEEPFEIRDSAGEVAHAGKLDFGGRASVLGLPPGSYSVVFPRLDEDTWTTVETENG